MSFAYYIRAYKRVVYNIHNTNGSGSSNGYGGGGARGRQLNSCYYIIEVDSRHKALHIHRDAAATRI
uniref:Uncharacterized protein n=1 Tax=Trichogramma kaykai TaxID=54128 RepID=A0ABD2XCT1_9HYME